jgi:glycosyltransferase involved in cell wall biosynthesis
MKDLRSLVIVSKALAPYRVRFYSEVARALNPYGWKVTLVVAKLGAGDHPWLDPGLKGEFLEIIEARTQNGHSSIQKAVDYLFHLCHKNHVPLPNLALIKELEERKTDVVWTHEYSPFCLIASLWAALRDRSSLLSTDLGSHPPKHACSPGQLWFQKVVSFLYQGVIANTKEATRRDHPQGAPILFAPHAIDTTDYLPASRGEDGLFCFLFVAGILREKGIVQLIEACGLMVAEGYDFELRVVGTGPLSDWLAKQEAPWLTIAGFIEGSALRKEYQDADAYVLPTMGDTYAVTVHEAAASGLPLIIGKSAGATETLVEDGVSGFRIDPEDVIQLAARMKDLLNNRPLAKAMGLRARELAVKLDVKVLGKLTADFILKFAPDEIR